MSWCANSLIMSCLFISFQSCFNKTIILINLYRIYLENDGLAVAIVKDVFKLRTIALFSHTGYS